MKTERIGKRVLVQLVLDTEGPTARYEKQITMVQIPWPGDNLIVLDEPWPVRRAEVLGAHHGCELMLTCSDGIFISPETRADCERDLVANGWQRITYLHESRKG